MPTYDYRCPACGPFTRLLSMAEVTPSSPCPRCSGTAGRVLSAPALLGGSSPIRRVRSAAEASAFEPAVTRRTPAAPREPTALPGRLAGLPRP